MRIKTLATSLFILFSTLSHGQNQWTFKDTKYSYTISFDTVLTQGINPVRLPTVKAITIYSGNREIQKIEPEEFLLDKTIDTSMVFILEDVNFDGNQDIRLLNGITVNLQKSYDYWLYEQKSGIFKYDTTLNRYTNLSFNPVEKTVHTWWRKGSAHYGHALCQWNQDQLELLFREEEYWIQERIGYYEQLRMINGKPVTRTKKIKKSIVNIYTPPTLHPSKQP